MSISRPWGICSSIGSVTVYDELGAKNGVQGGWSSNDIGPVTIRQTGV